MLFVAGFGFWGVFPFAVCCAGTKNQNEQQNVQKVPMETRLYMFKLKLVSFQYNHDFLAW